MNNEQIIRKAYELAEKVDVKGWVECHFRRNVYRQVGTTLNHARKEIESWSASQL